MPVQQDVSLSPIAGEDLARVGEFLHEHLDGRLSAGQWAGALTPNWAVAPPNHGFMLQAGGRVVGAYLALYSERVIAGETRRLCNLAAWCVQEEYRAHAVRLVRAMLRQRGFTFVDLSPSGNVVALNTRLGFTTLDTTTVLVPNLPIPGLRGVRILSRPGQIDSALTGSELLIARDHRGDAAALTFVVQVAGRSCLVVARKDRRKGLPVFASLLHVSDTEVFARAGRAPYRHLLRHGALVTLAELRVVGGRPRLGRLQRSPRPKMFRSKELAADDIDYLYSELTCVPW